MSTSGINSSDQFSDLYTFLAKEKPKKGEIKQAINNILGKGVTKVDLEKVIAKNLTLYKEKENAGSRHDKTDKLIYKRFTQLNDELNRQANADKKSTNIFKRVKPSAVRDEDLFKQLQQNLVDNPPKNVGEPSRPVGVRAAGAVLFQEIQGQDGVKKVLSELKKSKNDSLTEAADELLKQMKLLIKNNSYDLDWVAGEMDTLIERLPEHKDLLEQVKQSLRSNNIG